MSQVVLLGGPESGKSTYMGGLIDSFSMGSTRWLRLGNLPPDATAMEQLTAPLQEGNYSLRTAHDLYTPVELNLSTRGEVLPHRDFTLRSADYAGEQVNRVFAKREWAERWSRWATADAILLFLRPQATVPFREAHPRLSEAEGWRALRGDPPPPPPTRLNAALDAALGPDGMDEAPLPPALGPNDRVLAPTVLTLVELLQLLRESRGWAPGERPAPGAIRIALLVSAWDALEPAWQESGPGSYLARHAALLEDFLWSNFNPEDVYRFGLSTTGGDLKREAHREQYLRNPGGYVARTTPEGRVVRTNDLAQPLYWALFGDRGLNA